MLQGSSLVGTTVANARSSYLTTDRTFNDFELEFEVSTDADLNSGVQIRSTLTETGERIQGYQVEIDASPRRYAGGIYETAGRSWIYPLIDAPYARRAWKYGQWNQVRVRAVGPRIRTWVNGVPAADLFDERSLTGHIALQIHGIGSRKEPLKVRYKNLRVREFTRQ